MLQKREKNAYQIVLPKRKRNNYSRKELQKQSNFTLEPMVKRKNTFPVQVDTKEKDNMYRKWMRWLSVKKAIQLLTKQNWTC